MTERLAKHWPYIPERKANFSGKDGLAVDCVGCGERQRMSHPSPQSKTRCSLEMYLLDMWKHAGLEENHGTPRKVLSAGVLLWKRTRRNLSSDRGESRRTS